MAGIAGVMLLAAVTTGCEDHSPVPAPTSTLGLPESSPTETQPSVPEYETDLDLSDEEKEAVDGALVAFAGYIETINRVFSSGGKDLDGADRYARDGSLESLKKDADSMRSKNQYMAGKYGVYDVRVESVESAGDADTETEVSILFCTKDSEWSVVDLGEPLPSIPPRGAIMQHVATNADGEWKIAHQYLRSKTC